MNRKAKAKRGTANVCAQNTERNGTDEIKLIRLLARLLAPYLREELSASTGDVWIDQQGSPLGRRHHCELARCAAFPAHKEGRRWRALRSDVEAYIRAQRPGVPLDSTPANDLTPDEGEDRAVKAVLAEVGLEIAPAARSRRGRR